MKMPKCGNCSYETDKLYDYSNGIKTCKICNDIAFVGSTDFIEYKDQYLFCVLAYIGNILKIN